MSPDLPHQLRPREVADYSRRYGCIVDGSLSCGHDPQIPFAEILELLWVDEFHFLKGLEDEAAQ
jgi:hypothetical protein